MYSFKSGLIKTDVTVVKIYENFILVGVGNYLHVYSSAERELVERIFFCDEQIYDMDVCGGGKLLLYGAKTMKLFRVKSKGAIAVTELYTRECSDWILSAKFTDQSSQIVTVTMHNVATLWDSDLAQLQRFECEERCILYSAHVANTSWNNVVILSGTVFNQILVWQPKETSSGFCPILHRLSGHKGVIFSIDYNLTNGLICSTSDDRTAMLWSVHDKHLPSDEATITNKAVLYGHSARVFTCKVLDNMILTSCEDGLLLVWSTEGTLLRKIEAHQCGCIWSLDADEESSMIVSGGEDGGVSLFSLNALILTDHVKLEGPKKVILLSSSNLAIISEDGTLFYYNTESKVLQATHVHDDLKSYSLLEKSPCGKVLAAAGFHGNIHFYEDFQGGLKYKLSCQIKNKGRVFALHWLTCKLFLTCGPAGVLILWAISDRVVPLQFFRLPHSKERWITSACLCGLACILVGDRRGNLYLYSMDACEPIQLIRRAHNYLGVTNVHCKANDVISLGRNSSLNKYRFDSEQRRLDLQSSDKVPFSWLAAMYTTQSAKLLLGFAGNNLVIWDYNARRTLLEKNCGGGHRSWDCSINTSTFYFTYIKDKVIYLLSCARSGLQALDVIKGFHVNTINSLKLLQLPNADYFVISGGEDTTFRVSLTNFSTVESVAVLKSHLSSVRAICACKISEDKFLVFSGGGRAQVIMWELNVNASVSEIHSYYEELDGKKSEIRVMDLCTLKPPDGNVILFAGCSDGTIKLFSVNNQLIYLHSLTYKMRCILKIFCFQIRRSNVLITMATDGEIVIWDVGEAHDLQNVKPLCAIKAHQSGINTHSIISLSGDDRLILTGGDDNTIALNLVRFGENDGKASAETLSEFKDAGVHCAQITGSYLAEKYFLTASVDQKVCVFSWAVQGDKITIELLNTYITTICDIQGMECAIDREGRLKVIVYGNGFEILSLNTE